MRVFAAMLLLAARSASAAPEAARVPSVRISPQKVRGSAHVEELLKTAAYLAKDPLAMPPERTAAWCALAEAKDVNPYAAQAADACLKWKDYSAKWEKMKADLDSDLATLQAFMALKDKSKKQKAAAADAFLAAYKAPAKDWPSVFGPALARVQENRKRHTAKTPAAALGAEGTVLIPTGEFTMGSPDDQGSADEHPMHKVSLPAFRLGAREVTVKEYLRFAEETVRAKPPQPAWSTDAHPVVNVSFDDAKTYCEWAGRRLPTEAEWERAAKAGTRPALDDSAWYGANSARQAHPVGNKKPDAAELYDMLGNVWEWTADAYAEDSYKGKTPSGKQKAMRGCSWIDNAASCRPEARAGNEPGYKSEFVGFRCAMDAPAR